MLISATGSCCGRTPVGAPLTFVEGAWMREPSGCVRDVGLVHRLDRWAAVYGAVLEHREVVWDLHIASGDDPRHRSALRRVLVARETQR